MQVTFTSKSVLPEMGAYASCDGGSPTRAVEDALR